MIGSFFLKNKKDIRVKLYSKIAFILICGHKWEVGGNKEGPLVDIVFRPPGEKQLFASRGGEGKGKAEKIWKWLKILRLFIAAYIFQKNNGRLQWLYFTTKGKVARGSGFWLLRGEFPHFPSLLPMYVNSIHIPLYLFIFSISHRINCMQRRA